jgi:signal transduction histidine kinase
MTIHLISTDRELYNLCLEILAEIPELGQTWSLRVVSEANYDSAADLYLWDYHPNLSIPDHIQWNPLRHVILVDRKDLAEFHERLGIVEKYVILKPVDRASLATFVIAVISHRATRSLRDERDQILQCLIETSLKLQENDQERTAFLARAMHDFRSPLTALIGYCGLLLSEPMGHLTEAQTEILRRMQRSTQRLARMATAMFELNVGRHIARQPDLQPGDLRDCFQQALHEIAPFADEKVINITLDLTAPQSTLYFEAGQIEQALVNLLDNACRFTPRAGSIEIRGYPCFWERRARQAPPEPAFERRRVITHTPNAYRIDIADSGSPIPEEHLTTIFEEYTSCAGPRDRSGGGLGLAICKMVVTQHRGRIWAENMDTGPVFSFVLPFSNSDLRLPAPSYPEAVVETARGLRNAR